MKRDVHSVTVRHTAPTVKDIFRAVGFLATGRVEQARRALSGDMKLTAYDASGKSLYGIGGGSEMTLHVANVHVDDDEATPPAAAKPEEPVISHEDLALQQPVTVRTSPFSLRKP